MVWEGKDCRQLEAGVVVRTLRKHLSCGRVGMLSCCPRVIASAPLSEATWGGGLENLDLTLALSMSRGL